MSGRERGSSWKSVLLDKLLGDTKRTILVALIVAIIGYLLALIFGDIYATEGALIQPVLMGIVSFVAASLVLGFHLINPYCSANMMDFAEIFFALGSGVGLVLLLLMGGIGLLFSDEAYEVAAMIAGVSGLWCALCVIHNMRY